MTISTYEPAPAALTVTDPTGGRLVAWAEAAAAANSLAKALSTTAFVPREMQNVGNATAAILAGDEVGMSPLAALRSFYVVHGTPALYARAMVALAQAHGHEIWTSESTDSKVTVNGRRRGTDNIETATWTIQRAQKAGYTSNKKYASNPQEMLYSKASAEIARKIAADVLAGMPYSVEDLELDSGPTTAKVSRPATSKVSRKTEPEPVNMTDPDAAAADDDDTPDLDAITSAQQKKMGALMREADMSDRDVALTFVAKIIGREISSRNELSKAEAGQVIDALEHLMAEPPADPEQLSGAEFAAAAEVGREG